MYYNIEKNLNFKELKKLRGCFMKNLTIGVKLMMLICITLIPVIIVQTINIYYNFKRNTDQKLQANVELAQAISTSYFNYIEELWVQELIISKEILTEPNNTKKIQSYLESVINTEETALHRLSWVNPQGTATASTLKYMIGQSIAEREYFKKILAGEEKVFADLTKSYIDGTSVVPVARAVRKDGKLIGVLVASLDTNRLVSYIPNIKLNAGDILRLVDSNGNIVYDNTRSKLTFEERKMPSEALLEEAFQGKISKLAKYKSSLDGVYRMGVGYPMKELGWVCYISSVRSLVLKDTYRVAIQSIVCFIVVLALSILVSYKFGKK